MRFKATTIAVLSAPVVFMTSLPLHAQPVPPPQNCDITLFKTMETENVSKENYIFILDQVDQSNYEQMKTGIGASVPGYFDGSYDQFKEKRNQYRKSLQLTIDQKYSRQYAINTLRPEGLKAYTACLKAQRAGTDLSLFRDDTIDSDKRITFVVDLKTDVALRGPVRVEVFGGGKLLSAKDSDTTVRSEPSVLHIAIDNLISGKQFTVSRPNRTQRVQITAQIAGKIAKPLEIGPYLVAIPKEVDVPTVVENSYQLLARRSPELPGGYDFKWAHDNTSPGNNDVPKGTTFVGSACLCPGERTSWDDGFEKAGRCVPLQDPSSARVLVNTVTFSPGEYLRDFACAGQTQQAVTYDSRSGPNGVCYKIQLSLNAPDQTGSKTCSVGWTMRGTVRRKSLVFQSR